MRKIDLWNLPEDDPHRWENLPEEIRYAFTWTAIQVFVLGVLVGLLIAASFAVGLVLTR